MYILFLFVVLSKCDISGDDSDDYSYLEPRYTCWFDKYDEKKIGIVWGFENKREEEYIIPVTDELSLGVILSDLPLNVMNPSKLVYHNNKRPIVFPHGNHKTSFVTYYDESGGGGDTIIWTLGYKSAKFEYKNSLKNEMRCHVKLRSECPIWIDNFCEDSSYCNGREQCFSILGTTTGQCIPAFEPIKCNTGINEECSEYELSCINPILDSYECISDDDCVNFYDESDYCFINSYCDISLHKCMKMERTCRPHNLKCDSNLQMCIECNTDQACDDGVWCNGKEICDMNTYTCGYSDKYPCDKLTHTCDESNHQCIQIKQQQTPNQYYSIEEEEEENKDDDNSSTSDDEENNITTIAIPIIIVIVTVVFLIFGITLFIRSGSGSPYKSSKKRRRRVIEEEDETGTGLGNLKREKYM